MNPTATEFAIENPLWLAALALLPLLWVYYRRGLTHLSAGRRAASLAVRCLLVVLVVAALAGPKLRRESREVFLAVAYETGPGVGAEGAEQVEAVRRELLQRVGAAGFAEVPFPVTVHGAARAGFSATPEGDSPIFAAETVDDGATTPFVPRKSGQSPRVRLSFPEEPGRGPIDPAAALLAARAKVPADRVPRIVLLSAGNATAGDALGAAAAAGCPIDVVPLSPPQHEIYVAAVEAPAAVRYGEAFFVDVLVQSMHADEGRLALHVDGARFDEREVAVAPGANRFRFRQVSGGATASDSPWIRLSARIDGFRDTLPENNAAGAVVAVRPKARVLLVDPQPELADVLREALESDGRFEVEVRPAAEFPAQFAELLRYDLVIASNTPAEKFSEEQLAGLEQYVRDFGGGLIVVGGDRAFTAGNYEDTRLEAMLPVAAYVRPDKPRPSLAMMLLVDRSGSMQGRPIELARQAARQAVARLGPNDYVGILAFEDRVHWAVHLQPFTDAERIKELIGTIEAGGQSNIYPAMDQAYLALRDATTDLRHMIVISEGTYHPNDYYALVRRIAEDGITISTVGVGDEAPKELLRNIAEFTGGQAYFSNDPADMPRILELDVMAAGKHGITEKPFRPGVARPARMLAGFDPAGAPPLLGYVDTRAKPGSQLLLTAPSGDPVLAWWRYGRGVSVAFTSDVHSRWAAAWHRWPGFGGFWTGLARHAMRADPADRFTPGIARRGDWLNLTLDAVDADGRWVNSAEASVRVSCPDPFQWDLPCRLVEPGRYAESVPLESRGEYLGEYLAEFTVSLPGEPPHTVRRGVTLDYPEELRIRPANTELLRHIAAQTSGLFEPAMADLLRPAETSVPRTLRLWPWLLAAALLLFLLDLGLKRPTGR